MSYYLQYRMEIFFSGYMVDQKSLPLKDNYNLCRYRYRYVCVYVCVHARTCVYSFPIKAYYFRRLCVINHEVMRDG